MIKHCEEPDDQRALQRALLVNGAAEKHQLEARVSSKLVNGFLPLSRLHSCIGVLVGRRCLRLSPRGKCVLVAQGQIEDSISVCGDNAR